MTPQKRTKILLGGIPLGCDNVGDEAILASVVGLIRRNMPDADITVCTADLVATSTRLGVQCAPLYGFNRNLDLSGFAELVSAHDCYCWCGATGLSDYPDQAMQLVEIAQKRGVEVLIWGVGMDSTFNPAFFAIRGKKEQLLSFATKVCFKSIDFVRIAERFLVWRVRHRIRRGLSRCRLVVLRNEESRIEIEKCGFKLAKVGADTAILLPSAPKSKIERVPGKIKIGFCVSAQRKVTNSSAMTQLWQRLLDKGFGLVMIPMNPKTDRELMHELAKELNQTQIEWIESSDPEMVQAVAGNCDVLVSSRLHLLILGANELVPIIGIERGSKIANFLADFALTPAGTVDNCDFVKIESEIDRFVADNGKSFRKLAQLVHEMLLIRVAEAEKQLAIELNKLPQKG